MICDECLDKFKDYMRNLVSIAEAHYASEIQLLITFGTDEELRKMPWVHCHCGDLPEVAKLGFEPYIDPDRKEEAP